MTPPGASGHETNGHSALERDQQRALQLGRKLKVLATEPQTGPDIVRTARDGALQRDRCALVGRKTHFVWAVEFDWVHYVLQNAPCSVFLASHR